VSVMDAQVSLRALLYGLERSIGLSRQAARETVATLLGTTTGDVARRVDESASAELRQQAIAVAIRHSNGEPLAYALQSAAFRNLVLHVDRRVLIPRPETEIVVDEVLKAVANNPGGIAIDIGTGSGAIALALATEAHFDRVIATDISPEALVVARGNAEQLAAERPVEFREGADFEPLLGIKARVLVSNPPYIAFDEAEALPPSVRDWEPALALFADRGGMERYEVLLAGAPDYLEPKGWVVLEVDARRAQVTAAIAERDGRYTDIRIVQDLSQRDRVLIARVAG
jgi:release factor glutamine methyltransferase